jgi:hypothetical protein
MTSPLTIQRACHFTRKGHGGDKKLKTVQEPAHSSCEPGRVPRLARLMALAIRLDHLLRSGQVRNYEEIAQLGHISRARVSQILNLLNLAPDIQEALLFLPRTLHGRAPVIMRQLQQIAAVPDWRKQRRMWQPVERDKTAWRF